MADDDTKNPYETPERLALRHPAPELGARIIHLIEHEPFEEVAASLGLVLVCLLLSGAENPVEAFDGLTLRLRQALDEGRKAVEEGHTGVH